MLNNRCYILSSYFEKPNAEFFYSIKDENIPIICADGGQKIAKEFNLNVLITIGDFDSSSSLNPNNVVYPSEKNITDTEACIIYAKEQGFENITILGGLGGRADHSLGNLGLLSKYSVDLIDTNNHVRYLENESISVIKGNYTYLSIIPYGCKDITVWIKGVKYPLSNHTLSFNETLCISNEIEDNSANIRIQGSALIIESND